MNPRSRPSIVAKDVVRIIEGRRILDGVSLDIHEGEFFSLLGPSGCGKTTLLRCIAGFDRPDAGTLELDGVDLARVPTHRRDLNMVFQSYALFPHLDVFENVAFGLRLAGASSIPEKVREALDLVSLAGAERRKPATLSGGEQQRVALARAIVTRPKALLLDEPLGALDLKLRKGLQVELRRIQKTLGMTFLYVTHDQDEALSMSDRIAVMDGGKVRQIGTPDEVYRRPADEFVARFVGAVNVVVRDGRRVAIRPEAVRLAESSEIVGTVDSVSYFGARSLVRVAVGDATWLVEIPGSMGRNVVVGGSVALAVDWADAWPLEGAPS